MTIFARAMPLTLEMGGFYLAAGLALFALRGSFKRLRGPGAGAAIKPVKNKPNAPINFGGSGGKGGLSSNGSSNPYRGRLKQKGSHH